MSIFKGRVKELENVLIDDFYLDEETTFFLSHCHADHMGGLRQLLSRLHNKPSHYLYCSPISKLILLNMYSNVYDKVIKELKSSSIITIPESNASPEYQMTVTPIPAGHCPGSVMFLFETKRKTVLYTGDFRIAKGDIKMFKPLHSGNNQIKKNIDKLYFDATFLNKKYWKFPLRSEVVPVLKASINKWISKDPYYNVLLETPALYGYEFVFVELAKKMKCKIHVKDSFYDLYWNVPEIGCMLTKDCKSTKIHAHSMYDKKCSACNNQEELLTIKLSAQWYRSSKHDSKPIFKKVNNRKMLLCYSTHCSCSELLDFLNYLRPLEVEASTSTVGCSENEKKTYIQELMWSWSAKKCSKQTEPVKSNFRLEKNYKFKVKLPQTKIEDLQEDLFNSSEKEEHINKREEISELQVIKKARNECT